MLRRKTYLAQLTEGAHRFGNSRINAIIIYFSLIYCVSSVYVRFGICCSDTKDSRKRLLVYLREIVLLTFSGLLRLNIGNNEIILFYFMSARESQLRSSASRGVSKRWMLAYIELV